MTISEYDRGFWELDDVANFLATTRHSFHLTADPTMVVTAEGKKRIGGMKAQCSCGLKIGGLTDVKLVFDLIKSHCDPIGG